MNFNDFIQSKELEIDGKKFCISKIPAIQATEIYPRIAKYYADHGVLGLTMFDLTLTKNLLSYAAFHNGTSWEVLEFESVINRAFDSQFQMKKLISTIVKENWGFLTDGSLLDLLGVAEAETESGS